MSDRKVIVTFFFSILIIKSKTDRIFLKTFFVNNIFLTVDKTELILHLQTYVERP